MQELATMRAFICRVEVLVPSERGTRSVILHTDIEFLDFPVVIVSKNIQEVPLKLKNGLNSCEMQRKKNKKLRQIKNRLLQRVFS